MAKELHSLPHVSTQGGIAGGDLVLIKKTVLGVPLDFKVDFNTLFAGYLKDTEIGTGVGDLFRLIDSGGNAALPSVSGALLTNLNIPQASGSIEGAVTLSDAINGSEGVTNGYAATPKSVADLNALCFKKAGGELSGSITIPNNVALKLKLNSGSPLDILLMDANNDLLVGAIGGAPDQIKAHVDTSFDINDNTGALKFSFNVDGTSSGVRALDVSAAAKTSLPAGTVDSQLGTLAVNKMDSTGGAITGHLELDNTIGIQGDLLVGTAINLASVDVSDVVQLGSTLGAKTRISGGAGGIELYTGGAVRLAVAADGTITGFGSDDILYPSGTGGVTGANVQDAISWLGSNKLGSDGLVGMANNVAYGVTDFGGTNRASVLMNASDEMRFGNVLFPNVQQGSSLAWKNAVGTTELTLSSGKLSGTAFVSDTLNFSGTGGLVATNVQDAINEVNANAISGEAAEFTGTINFANAVGITTRNVLDTANLNTIKLGIGDLLEVGQGGAAGLVTTGIKLHSSGNVDFVDNAGGVSFSVNAQAGTLTGFSADKITSTATGTIAATNVQAAIAELATEKLNTGSTAFDSSRLGGTLASAFSTKVTADGLYLAAAATASNSLQLGGVAAALFSTKTVADGLYLAAGGTANLAANSNALGGVGSASFSTTTQGDARWLGISAKANSATTTDQLGGIIASSYARKNVAQTLTGTQTFSSSPVFSAGSITGDDMSSLFGNSGDAGISYDGASNTFRLDLASACTDFLIRDNVTTRFTFNKATGDFTATGDVQCVDLRASGLISEGGTSLSTKYLGISAKANSATTTDQLGGVPAASYRTTAQGDARWLGLTAKATTAITADTANQLGGLLPTDYARRNTSQTITGTQTFSNLVNLDGSCSLNDLSALSLGTSGDIRQLYDGVANNFQMEMKSNVNNFQITDITTLPSPNGSLRFQFARASGDFWAAGNITAYSDINVKTNIQPIENALEKVRNLGGHTFERTDVDVPRQLGTIAQWAEVDFPEAVSTNSEGKKSVAYGNLAVAGGFAAISELADIVDNQADIVSKQAYEISELKDIVRQLLEVANGSST